MGSDPTGVRRRPSHQEPSRWPGPLPTAPGPFHTGASRVSTTPRRGQTAVGGLHRGRAEARLRLAWILRNLTGKGHARAGGAFAAATGATGKIRISPWTRTLPGSPVAVLSALPTLPMATAASTIRS